jgi:hypothetical protein
VSLFIALVDVLVSVGVIDISHFTFFLTFVVYFRLSLPPVYTESFSRMDLLAISSERFIGSDRSSNQQLRHGMKEWLSMVRSAEDEGMTTKENGKGRGQRGELLGGLYRVGMMVCTRLMGAGKRAAVGLH